MNNNKQSSVEWLYDQMSNIAAGYATELNQQEILEKAKVMHEREVKDAYIISSFINETRNPEQYYNETFNQ